jgi:hypothetical protein
LQQVRRRRKIEAATRWIKAPAGLIGEFSMVNLSTGWLCFVISADLSFFFLASLIFCFAVAVFD